MEEPSEFKTAASPDAIAVPPSVARAEWVLAALGGLILFATMVMTTIDVVGRYVFDRPLGYAYEMTELLMALVVFVSIAGVTLRGEHIVVALFEGIWSRRAGAVRDLVIALVMAACLGFLAYRMILFTGRFIRYGDITNMLKMPLYPTAALGAIGIGLAAIAALVVAYDAIRRIMRG